MALTAQQLRDRALRKLNVIGSGQSAPGEDAKLVDDLVGEMFDEYSEFFVFDSTATPDWAVPSVVDMLAARSSPYFDGAPIAMTERDAFAAYSTAKERRIDQMKRPIDLGFY